MAAQGPGVAPVLSFHSLSLMQPLKFKANTLEKCSTVLHEAIWHMLRTHRIGTAASFKESKSQVQAIAETMEEFNITMGVIPASIHSCDGRCHVRPTVASTMHTSLCGQRYSCC